MVGGQKKWDENKSKTAQKQWLVDMSCLNKFSKLRALGACPFGTLLCFCPISYLFVLFVFFVFFLFAVLYHHDF